MAGKEYKISFKLGAATDSTLTKSFSSVSGSLKDMHDKVNQLSKGKGVASTTKPIRDDLAKTQQSFFNTENAANKMGDLLKKVAVTVGTVFAARKLYSVGKNLVMTYAEFEQEMQNVKSLSGATADEFAALTAQAKHLNATTVFTGKQAAEGQAFLAMAGYKTNDILAAMPGLLSAAAAGKEELGVTADITSNILQGFGIAASETGRVADVLTKAFTSSNVTMGMIGETMKYVAPQSKAAGISLEETAAAAGILGNAGIQASMAGTGLRSIIARMAAPTGGAAKLMKKLGINVINADGSLKSLAGIVEQVTKGTEKMGEAQRISAIKTMAGQYAASSMLSLMDVGADKLREFTNELENSGGAAEQIAKTQLDSFSGSMTLLQSAVQSAKIAIGEKMAPVIRKMADQIAANLPKVVEQFEKSWQSMTTSPSWQNADWLQKIQIVWDRIISKPFQAWWKAQGKAEFEKVAGEIGKTIKRIVGGIFKEAFTGSGATQLLSAGALTIPGIQVGKGVVGTVKAFKAIGLAGSSAGAGVGAATKAAGLFGPALGLLLNPIGLAVAGVGALALGYVAYRKHQEKARQELINMGGALQEAQEKYQAVADKSELTKSLATEYRELDKAVKNNVGTAEELVLKQERMAEITTMLQDMFPQTLTNYDIEKGKMLDKLGLMEQMSEAELELERLRLQTTIAQKSAQQSKLEKEVGNISGEIDKAKERVAAIEAEKDALDKAIPMFRQYETELQKISQMEYSEDKIAMMDNLLTKANELGGTVGRYFSGAFQLDGITNSLQKDLVGTYEKLEEALNKQATKMGELETAKSSYNELYDAQVKLIELDLGGTIEQQAEKYKDLTAEEKKRFDGALVSIAEINNRMAALPTEHKINVSVMFDEANGLTGIPQKVRQVNDLPVFKLPQYGDGGFANSPSIFGEEGLEAAVPIDNRPRSHAILDRVNQMMGRDSGGGGTTNVAFAPVINVQGGGPDTAQQVQKVLQDEQERFKRWWEQMKRDERRLAF